MKKYFLLISLFLAVIHLNAQWRKSLRSFDRVITPDARVHKGPFTVYTVRDSFFFEIPDTLLGRDMMLINRLNSGPFQQEGSLFGVVYPGESLHEGTLYFAFGPDSVINLREDNTQQQAQPDSRIGAAVRDAKTDGILDSFVVVARNRQQDGFVVSAMGFLKGPGSAMKMGVHAIPSAVAQYQVEYIHAYPINIEFGIYRRWMNGSVTVTNTSLVLLPKAPMAQRLFDRRVGYFAHSTYYFADDQQRAVTREFIQRWRLEPRPEDRGRWLKGELVEPQKPIIYYIDPHTPKQWVKYLVRGVDDWQKAFEQAGFKNAIQGREWPYGDSVDLNDARYSFICYLPSATANAYGPAVVDPRSGEVIQSHVGWYHNVMSLVHDWYLIQAAATDPRARYAQFDDDLMGELIRFVSSHEVGHTLGLRHNFGSSSQTPVEKMRDAAWLKLHGHTASIMDYARFNYVAQPGDHIPEDCLWPHVGEYDRWAIQWGYKFSGTDEPMDDAKIVGKWVTDSLAANPRRWFGSEEGFLSVNFDPRCQTEDLGDNNMTANAYGIMNLKRIISHLPEWCGETNGQYERLQEGYSALLGQFKRYMGHVLTNVAGRERTYRTEEEAGAVFTPVSKAKQRQALAFFNTQLFITPVWLLDKRITGRVAQPQGSAYIARLQSEILQKLLGMAVFSRLDQNSQLYGPEAAYAPDEYLATLHRDIWGVIQRGEVMDPYRRNLQKSYINDLSAILLSRNPGVNESNTWSLVQADLHRLQKEIRRAIARYPAGGADREHLESADVRLTRLLTTKIVNF